MKTKLISSKQDLIDLKAEYKSAQKKIALVPTMGALHEGHLSLVKIAKDFADLVIVSIFVNPLQFAANEDFSKYPKTLEKDLQLLENLEVDYVFAPNTEDLYSSPPKQIKANPEITNKLCGLSRPGHFDGVCTVVNLLFELIEPDYAIFGEKDYQQLEVIKSMVKELNLKVQIIPATIVRESSGLALSSRNQYLSESQKELASNIYKQLSWLAKNYSQENSQQVINELNQLGIKVEYLEKDWGRVLIAARVSEVRLIDNINEHSEKRV